MAELGSLPLGRRYTLTYAVEAVRALVGDYLLRVKGASLEQLDAVVPCDRMCPNCLLTENCSLRDERIDVEFGGLRRFLTCGPARSCVVLRRTRCWLHENRVRVWTVQGCFSGPDGPKPNPICV